MTVGVEKVAEEAPAGSEYGPCCGVFDSMAEDDPFLFEVMTALTFRKIEVMLGGMVERDGP